MLSLLIEKVVNVANLAYSDSNLSGLGAKYTNDPFCFHAYQPRYVC